MAQKTIRIVVQPLGLDQTSGSGPRRLDLFVFVWQDYQAGKTPPELDLWFAAAGTSSKAEPATIKDDDPHVKFVEHKSQNKLKYAIANLLNPHSDNVSGRLWLMRVSSPVPAYSVIAAVHKRGGETLEQRTEPLFGLPMNTPNPTPVALQFNYDYPEFAVAICNLPHPKQNTHLVEDPGLYLNGDLGAAKEICREMALRLKKNFDTTVWSQIEERAGRPGYLFGLLWLGWMCKDPPPKPAGFASLADLKIYAANELWARRITELLTLTPYSGPDMEYFGMHSEHRTDDPATVTIGNDDDVAATEVYEDLCYRLFMGISADPDRTENFFPLVAACQHLANLGVLSRGQYFYRIGQKKNITEIIAYEASINAGAHAAVTFTQRLKPKPGAWSPNPSTPGKAITDKDLDDAGLEWMSGNASAAPSAAQLRAMKGENQGPCEFGPGAIAIFSNHLASECEAKASIMAWHNKDTCLHPPADVNAYAQKLFYKPGDWDRWHVQHQQWITDMTAWQALPAAERQKKPMPKHPKMLNEWPLPKAGSKYMADNTLCAHAGFVLRVHPLDPPSQPKYQVFDTGGFGMTPSPGVSVITVGGGTGGINHTGNYDYPAMPNPQKSTISGGDPYRGIGLPPKADEASANSLVEHMRNVVMQARPLGFARLLVVNLMGQPDNPNFAANLKNWLIFASRTIPMWGVDDFDNFPISRFIWSLREFPMRQYIRVFWSIRIPYKALTRQVMAIGQRSTPLTELADNALAYLKADGTKRPRDLQLAQRLEGPWVPHVNPSARDRRMQHLRSVDAQTYARRRLLYELTRPLMLVEATSQGDAGARYYHTCKRDIGTQYTFYAMELDEMPMDVAVIPVASSPTGIWEPAKYDDWTAAQQSAAKIQAPLDALLAGTDIGGA